MALKKLDAYVASNANTEAGDTITASIPDWEAEAGASKMNAGAC